MTIVLCGGGSGGHITPLLAVAAELRKRHKDVKLIYIGEKNGKFSSIATGSRLFDETHSISAGKLRRYHGESLFTKALDIKTNFLNFRDVFKMSAGILQSHFLLRKLKPDALFLKGGFVCVPVAFAAKSNNIPYITHDSDALPGLSNRIAARWAKYHATAMPAKYYSYPEATVRVVGVPSDERFRDYSEAEVNLLKEKYGFKPADSVLLLTGGSNGARRLNEAFLDILPSLLEKNSNLRILHQVGQGNDDQLANFPEELKSKIFFFHFTDELFHMSAIADLIITRAGASAMADYGAQSKACVVVPNPYLTGGHQLKNARVYEEAEAAVIVPEDNLPEALYDQINYLLKETGKRRQLGINLHNLLPETKPAVAISELIESLIK